MANIAAYAEKVMLDYVCGGATPTRPATWYINVASGNGAQPSSTSGSEIATGSGMTRQTVTFGAAASPAGSVSNANAITIGPINAGGTISGVQIWDTGAATAGNMLFYGNLATARTMLSGDSLVFAAGALTISLA